MKGRSTGLKSNMAFKIGIAQKRKKNLEEELQRLIPQIIKLDVEKIILFGSLASGNIHKSSDIDIIVVKKTEKRFFDRLEEFYKHLKPRYGMDILIYSVEEFEEMKNSNQFIKSALKKGRIIYER